MVTSWYASHKFRFTAEVIEAFNSTSRYLNDLLNIDNPCFEGIVSQIYAAEMHLNKRVGRKLSESDSIQSQISSKTSRGKKIASKDTIKEPGEQFSILANTDTEAPF